MHFTVGLQLFPGPPLFPFLEMLFLFFQTFSDYFTSLELAACYVRAAVLSDMW